MVEGAKIEDRTPQPREKGDIPHREERREVSSIEAEVRNLQAQRKRESRELIGEGKTLGEMVGHFDNDFGPLEELYKEKTGVDLIADPYESAEHEIAISKSLSMVIPSYNSGEQLHKTLLAAQASSFNAKYPGQFEVIVVDDGSPNVNIGKMVEEWDIQDLNVTVLRQTNGRENKGRYSGLLESQSDIILFTSQDIVYSPTMIEEFMKRHEVLGDVACFGLQNEIDTDDPALEERRIAEGSLGDLSIRFDHDPRVSGDGMADCGWAKEGGHNRDLPIDTNDEWSWNLSALPWGQSVSAPREVLLRTVCSTDERYKGYGTDDEQLIADLIAEGLYIIPNTGGIYYHQRHPTRRDIASQELNARVYAENLANPPKRQDIENPVETDAQVAYSRKNTRIERRDPVGEPKPDRDEHAKVLLQMGEYDRADEAFGQIEGDHAEDVWFLHDYGQALTALGKRSDVDKAVGLLEKAVQVDAREEQENDWVLIRLAQAYGRRGEYNRARVTYERARQASPDNPNVQFLAAAEEDLYAEATRLHEQGVVGNMDHGKYRSALIYFDQALALVGEQAEPWSVFDKGKALLALGNTEEAITSLERAVQLMPHETWTNSQLGIAYEQKGDNHQARRYYSEALRSDPGNHEAFEGLERLGLGLLDWDEDFPERRSETLRENPHAQLEEETEIRSYIERWNVEYYKEIEAMDNALQSPMEASCRAPLCIPAYEEGRNIYHTLEQFVNQKRRNGETLPSAAFEIVIMDNHPASIDKDETESEIKRFQ